MKKTVDFKKIIFSLVKVHFQGVDFTWQQQRKNQKL